MPGKGTGKKPSGGSGRKGKGQAGKKQMWEKMPEHSGKPMKYKKAKKR